jgi:hypothetical protein
METLASDLVCAVNEQLTPINPAYCSATAVDVEQFVFPLDFGLRDSVICTRLGSK